MIPLHRLRFAEVLVAFRHIQTIEPDLLCVIPLIEEQKVRRDRSVRGKAALRQADDRMQIALFEKVFLNSNLRIIISEEESIR
jgi:hypothetical protein